MRTLFALPLALLLAAPAAADDCRYTEPWSAEIDAAGASVVRIEAAAGYLRVYGEPGAPKVRIDGTACASRQSTLERIGLDWERRGDEIRIETDLPDSDGWRDTARLDLTISIPSNLAVEIDDGSGAIEIRDVAALELDDGSGEIDVEGVAGRVSIRDGSGEMDLRDLGGPVVLRDGSGEIDVRDVRADVEVLEDGSGEITIRDVDGNVRIREDGSGSIVVRDVTGDLIVEDDGSGGIRYDRIAGRVRVPRD